MRALVYTVFFRLVRLDIYWHRKTDVNCYFFCFDSYADFKFNVASKAFDGRSASISR